MEAVAEVLTAALAGQRLKWSHTIKLYNSKTKIGLIYTVFPWLECAFYYIAPSNTRLQMPLDQLN